MGAAREQSRVLLTLSAALHGLFSPAAPKQSAYTAGIAAGPGSLCPYLDQASVDGR